MTLESDTVMDTFSMGDALRDLMRLTRENEALRALLKQLADDGKADGLSPIGPWLKEIDDALNREVGVEAIDIPKFGLRIYLPGADGIPVAGPMPDDAKKFHAAFGDVERADDDAERLAVWEAAHKRSWEAARGKR